MNKARRTMMNAVVGAVSLVVSSVFFLVVNRLLLKQLGSEYNGVNATITQSLAVLTLLEGGFSLASLVALFKPYTSGSQYEMNAILSTTRQSFNRIGVYVLTAGTVISFAFPIIMKTSLPYPTLVIMYLLSLLPLSFNFAFILKYRLVFQVSQTEYIVGLINLITTILIQTASVLILLFKPNILMIRAVHAVFSIFSGFLIMRIANKRFPYLDYSMKADSSLIKGTKDVFVGNVTSYFYASSTVLFLSVFIGTVSTSVYAVYNSIVTIVAQAVYVVLQSPQNALGQVIAESNEEKTIEVFNLFEYITILAASILLSITYSLILSFIAIYTAGIRDAEYLNNLLPLMLILTSMFELIHIPSGLCINLHGRFRTARNIQLSASVIIIVASVSGAMLLGVTGVIAAKLLTAFFLAIAEIVYVRTRVLRTGLRPFLSVLLPNVLFAALLALIAKSAFADKIRNYGQFFIYATLISIVITFSMILLNWLLHKQMFGSMIRMLKSAISSSTRIKA